MAHPSLDEIDEQFIRRAIRLAMNGRGRVEPNPMVACVLVKDNRVIGEGYHAQFGGPHAEPTALANCTESPAGATAYVTLEPCCHTNKKTPPCAPRLIEAKVARVVIGCLDPNPAVNGNGVAMLRAAGIRVDGPVLEGEATQLIAPFLVTLAHGRPYITLKWAETSDKKVAGSGKVGLVDGKRLQISNEESTRLVHTLRSRSDAILVGANTIVVDDPLLTTRGVETLRPLLRAGVTSRRGLFLNGNLQKSMAEGPVVLYCTEPTAEKRSIDKLRRLGAEVSIVERTSDGLVDLRAVLSDLHRRKVTHLMVEPGPTLAKSLLATDLVDRTWVFRSPMRIENDPGRPAPKIPGEFVPTGHVELSGDTLVEYLNRGSAAFFAAEPSADFVLARDAIATSSQP